MSFSWGQIIVAAALIVALILVLAGWVLIYTIEERERGDRVSDLPQGVRGHSAVTTSPPAAVRPPSPERRAGSFDDQQWSRP